MYRSEPCFVGVRPFTIMFSTQGRKRSLPAVCPEGGLLRSSFLIASDLSLLYSAHRVRRGFDFALNCSGVFVFQGAPTCCRYHANIQTKEPASFYANMWCVSSNQMVSTIAAIVLWKKPWPKTSALDGLVKIYSIKQQSRSTSVRSGNMSHVGAAAFHDHLDDGFVVFRDEISSSNAGNMCVRWYVIEISNESMDFLSFGVTMFVIAPCRSKLRVRPRQ